MPNHELIRMPDVPQLINQVNGLLTEIKRCYPLTQEPLDSNLISLDRISLSKETLEKNVETFKKTSADYQTFLKELEITYNRDPQEEVLNKKNTQFSYNASLLFIKLFRKAEQLRQPEEANLGNLGSELACIAQLLKKFKYELGSLSDYIEKFSTPIKSKAFSLARHAENLEDNYLNDYRNRSRNKWTLFSCLHFQAKSLFRNKSRQQEASFAKKLSLSNEYCVIRKDYVNSN